MGRLALTALRTKSVYAREIFVAGLWPGHTEAEINDWTDEAARGLAAGAVPSPLPPGMKPEWAIRYAQVLAVQTGSEVDAIRARALLESMRRSEYWELAPRYAVELLLHLRVTAGERYMALTYCAEEIGRLRPDVAQAARTDVSNPYLRDPIADEQVWLREFNDTLHGSNMSDLSLRAQREGECARPFDRLQGPPLDPFDAPERVTVLMSSFRPGPALLTAVRSVLTQTWQNFELFIIDDASGGSGDEVLRDAVALDPRIKVIRKAVNGGTYRARNTALRLATGDVAITLDSDDYWHPQTLEVAIAPLLAKPNLMASRSRGVRVSESLELTRVGYRPRFVAAATLMFRFRPVLSRVGFFDTTSKGADTEFANRIISAFGPTICDIDEVVCLLRSGDTLSSAEFSHGWRHPARHEYKSNYNIWHRKIQAGIEPAYLDPEQPRPFPEPLRWAKPPVLSATHQAHYDLCLAGDWRRFEGPQLSMMEEMAAARAAGLRVAIMHLEAFRFVTAKDLPLCDPIMKLIYSGQVAWVHADDRAEIDVLMIRSPSILQYPPFLTRSVTAKHVLVIANQAPLERDGSEQRYVVTDVSQRAEELFGQPVQWVPQSAVIRALLLSQDPEVALTAWDSPGVIDAQAWDLGSTGAPALSERSVVVGRCSRDDMINFPSTYAELLRAYTFGEGYEVKMMGATNALRELVAAQGPESMPIPDNWTATKHKSQSTRDFLAELDFFLDLDTPDADEAFGRTLLEAAASGVLTIAHPRYQSTFGDAIDYALPGEAQNLIAHYVAHPVEYMERVTSSRARVVERYGRTGFVDRLRPLLGGERESSLEGVAEPANGGEFPLRVSLAQGRTGQIFWSLSSVSDHYGVLSVPFRSVGDGARADSLSVCFWTGEPRESVEDWLRAGLAQGLGPSDHGLLERLLVTAPECIRLVSVSIGGCTSVAGRGRWEPRANGVGRQGEKYEGPCSASEDWDRLDWASPVSGTEMTLICQGLWSNVCAGVGHLDE